MVPPDRRRGALAAARIVLSALCLSLPGVCAAGPYDYVPKYSVLLPHWSGWKSIPDIGTKNYFSGPFLTGAGCSATYLTQTNQLFVAAQRASDHTIWLNSISKNPNVWAWDGWQQLKYLSTTLTPAIDCHYAASGTLYLDVVAVANLGASNTGVYITSRNCTTGQWSGWTAVPGQFATNTSVSIRNGHLFAKGHSDGAVYENVFDQPGNWSGWHPLPSALKTNTQVCAFGWEKNISLYASRAADGHLFSIDYSYFFNGSWGDWYPEQPLTITDAKAAGPLPEGVDAPAYYDAFVKGIGDHQVYGLHGTALQLIPGSKLTDSGIESRSMRVSTLPQPDGTEIDNYCNLIFVRDPAD
jgi:hypothetical protein